MQFLLLWQLQISTINENQETRIKTYLQSDLYLPGSFIIHKICVIFIEWLQDGAYLYQHYLPVGTAIDLDLFIHHLCLCKQLSPVLITVSWKQALHYQASHPGLSISLHGSSPLQSKYGLGEGNKIVNSLQGTSVYMWLGLVWSCKLWCADHGNQWLSVIKHELREDRFIIWTAGWISR